MIGSDQAAAALLASLHDDHRSNFKYPIESTVLVQASARNSVPQAISRSPQNARKKDCTESITSFFPAAPIKTMARGKRNMDDHQYPVEPRVIQVIKKPRTVMNHSYRDFSIVPPEDEEETRLPTEIEQMSFLQKLHHLLGRKELQKYAGWMPHGRSFKVHIPSAFEEKVALDYFEHKRYSSFLRQLSNHGFKHISKGRDRNCYYHEKMLRGLPHLIKYMPKPKDARRLIPDPESEPNLYKISQEYPLPDDPDFGKGENFDDDEESVQSTPPVLQKPPTPQTSSPGKARLASESQVSPEYLHPNKRQATEHQYISKTISPMSTSPTSLSPMMNNWGHQDLPVNTPMMPLAPISLGQQIAPAAIPVLQTPSAHMSMCQTATTTMPTLHQKSLLAFLANAQGINMQQPTPPQPAQLDANSAWLLVAALIANNRGQNYASGS